jgi:5-methylcytosine-specific restriction endonuclease McrA
MAPQHKSYSLDELCEAVRLSHSKCEMARILFGYLPCPQKIKRTCDIIVALALDTSHWTGLRGKKETLRGPKKKLEQMSKCALRKRVLREHLIEERCAICGLGPEWQGRPLALHLDHIDGNGKNHTETNLRFLCPNCHQQTTTWGNVGRGRLPSDTELLKLVKTMSNKEIGQMFGVSPTNISHRLEKYRG